MRSENEAVASSVFRSGAVVPFRGRQRPGGEALFRYARTFGKTHFAAQQRQKSGRQRTLSFGLAALSRTATPGRSSRPLPLDPARRRGLSTQQGEGGSEARDERRIFSGPAGWSEVRAEVRRVRKNAAWMPRPPGWAGFRILRFLPWMAKSDRFLMRRVGSPFFSTRT